MDELGCVVERVESLCSALDRRMDACVSDEERAGYQRVRRCMGEDASRLQQIQKRLRERCCDANSLTDLIKRCSSNTKTDEIDVEDIEEDEEEEDEEDEDEDEDDEEEEDEDEDEEDEEDEEEGGSDVDEDD